MLCHCHPIVFTARDTRFYAEESEPYRFLGYLLPSGEVGVSYPNNADAFWDAPEDVEACGLDTIESYEILDATIEINVGERLRQSAAEYGEDAIPLSLRFVIESR